MSHQPRHFREFRFNGCSIAWLAALVCLIHPLSGSAAAQGPAVAANQGVPAAAGSERWNVLLILVDDLKPALGCYGDPHAKTPNLDRLAGRGLRFDAAYCNQAVCAPSRFTLMLGAHSTTTGLYGLGSQLREQVPEAVTMPQYFASHGYRTESLGKVFHIGHGNLGDAASFSVPHWHEKVIEYVDPASTDGGQLTREEALFGNQQLGRIPSLPRGAAFESPDVDDLAYADGRVAAEAIKRLAAAKQRQQQSGTPFFMAVGFARPHLPFSVPKKYWDLHDPAQLPLPKFEQLPAGSPAYAGKRGGEIAAYRPVPVAGDAPFSEDLKRTLIHGYYASASYVDAQIGKVLEALDELQLTDRTIVVLWGDHGFHLGDLGIWTKHTNYEQANRIPLVIAAPGVTRPGQSTGQLAESVDLFPTLAELAGLPRPEVPQAIDGLSLVPVLKDPLCRVRDHAYHAYPRKRLGRAIRTERYRLIAWGLDGEDEPPEYELFDYRDDPLEQRNLAKEKPAVVVRLQAILAGYPAPYSRAAGRPKKGQPDQSPAPPEGGTKRNPPGTHQPRLDSPVAARGPTPNIITVFIDDMGYSDLSCFGGKRIETSGIDRLAAEGIRFTNFYVNSPICSPSRTALTTGQYPYRWRLSSYLDNRAANAKRGMAQWLDPAAPILARELQRAGYATGHFGKWHLGGQRDVGDAPLITEYGFDRSLTNFEGLGPRVLGYRNDFGGGQPKLHDLGSQALGRGEIRYLDRSEITGAYVAEAIEFIDQAVASSKPFFVNVWPDDVHSPFFPPQELRAAAGNRKRDLYYAVLQALDRQLQPLFDRVANDQDLRQRTLILICSDNGHEAGAGISEPLRGGKTWLYEGGIRSPLIVWGPGCLHSERAGSVNQESVFSAMDLNRSLYSLTGTPLPTGAVLDGEDLSQTLLGNEQASRQAPLFFRRPPDRPGFSHGYDEDNPDLAVRAGRWKFLVNYDGSQPQLYDLQQDPSESRNQVAARPEIARQWQQAVADWNATMPVDAGDPAFSVQRPAKSSSGSAGR